MHGGKPELTCPASAGHAMLADKKKPLDLVGETASCHRRGATVRLSLDRGERIVVSGLHHHGSSRMRQAVTVLAAVLLAMPAAAMVPMLAGGALAQVPCSGHKLLPDPRPATSCLAVAPPVYASPDKALLAIVLPADVSLYATPDMESRVVIRNVKGDTLMSKDYSSPRGTNGYYVDQAKWSPDSQFFVFSLLSSGGHSPWSHPMAVYSRSKNQFAKFSDMIGDKPTLSGEFTFSGPHTVTATTWRREGAPDDKVPVTVDLEAAFAKLPPGSD
jgi:hypothetical protein